MKPSREDIAFVQAKTCRQTRETLLQNLYTSRTTCTTGSILGALGALLCVVGGEWGFGGLAFGGAAWLTAHAAKDDTQIKLLLTTAEPEPQS